MRLTTGHMIEDILDSLFPRLCPLCRAKLRDPDRGFCGPCFASFEFIRPPVCFQCGIPLRRDPDPSAPCCTGCLPPGPAHAPACSEVRSVALHTGPLRQAILAWKYGGRLALSSSLGWLLHHGYRSFFSGQRFDCIVPVPLHVRRLRERGYNQCTLLAGPLAKRLGVRVDLTSVKKVRNTQPQSGGGRRRRRTNLHGAFAVVRPARFKERCVLILDDVVTTGVTIQTLAGVLRAAGARRVCAFTLTRSLESRGGTAASNTPRGEPSAGGNLDRMYPYH